MTKLSREDNFEIYRLWNERYGLMKGFFGMLKREMFYGFEDTFKDLEALRQKKEPDSNRISESDSKSVNLIIYPNFWVHI